MNAADFKPMLAKDGDLSKLKFPVTVQPKLDGIRASVVGGKLRSRTLKPIPNAEIRAALERPEFEGLDGELIVGEPTATDVYRKTSSFVMSESKTGQPWAYMVFDKWDSPFGSSVRYMAAESIVQSFDWTDVPIFMVANSEAKTMADLERMEALLIEMGYEGAIVRDPFAPYKFGRSGKTGPLIKVKRFIDFEAEVVGVFEEQHNGNVGITNALGRTERSTAQAGKTGKGTLGGLVVRAINGPAEGVEFRVGTGFDAQQRASLWQLAGAGNALAWNGLLGEVAKVKSFPIGVKDKPRHPVFLGWRDMEVDG